MVVMHEGNAAKNLGGDDIASEGHALAGNRFLYHVVAVTGLCLPFFYHTTASSVPASYGY